MKFIPVQAVATLAVASIMSLGFSSCEDPQEKAARQLLGKGLQAESKSEMGDPFAIYSQVIKKYPDTKAAIQAKERQEAMAEKLRKTAESFRNR